MTGRARAHGFSARLAAAGLLACLLLASASGNQAARAAEDQLAAFFGTYVGTARVEDLRTGEERHRHMDIVIEPYDGGFRLHWVNVSLVDGRRDVPGVERRVQTVLFQPSDTRDFFVEVEEGTPFREREATRPMRGDPVRWAAIHDRTLHVNSFVVLDDGRYELQTYDRVLTDEGLRIEFQRIVDGELIRRITGSTVRAETKVAED
jgi:hypothetical protein